MLILNEEVNLKVTKKQTNEESVLRNNKLLKPLLALRETP